MDDTVKKTFRISKKASNELDFIRSYFNKSFGDTLEIIISHARLRIDEEVNIKVKDELKETTSQISFEYQKLNLEVNELRKELENFKDEFETVLKNVAESFDNFSEDLQGTKREITQINEKGNR